ncbi:hypothetical protein SLEP1_g2667 [Rubroshorea leprosula]|uniref:Uncharacterized protein n=1 Tax=Rubroshorea leprosula TaxID=152421 RepID=A0AAV5HIB5_9ROSI|nr:hypothetical protein SLEP1_g2667 [Rubroshorea leprosula]
MAMVKCFRFPQRAFSLLVLEESPVDSPGINHNHAGSSFPLRRSRSPIRCLCLSSLLDLEKSVVDTSRINHCLCLSSTDEMLVRGRVSGVPPRISQIGVNDGPGDGRCLMSMDYCQCDET